MINDGGHPMKKLLLSTTFMVLGSAAVMAADLPMQTKATVAAAPVFSWTGCYLGVHAGGGLMTSSNTEGNGKGGLAGGQAGCNYQDGNWVFGVEGEGYWSGIRMNQASSNIPNIVTNNSSSSFSNTINNNNDFSIAARAGVTFDRTLIYGKGGWAWGAFKTSSINICCGVGSTTTTTAQSGTLDGFLVGAGIEHALTRNWTVKAEYNFIGFGGKELATTACRTGVCGVTGTNTISATKQVFKVGANYLFDFGGAPLVARY
jgi:outer membrane immunogenic protein